MEEQTEESWFDPEATTFGDRLAGARELAGMSQSALARRLGVKLSTLTRWENDLSEPRANKLSMLSGLLNVSIRWLLTGEGRGPGAPEDEDNLVSLGDVMREVQRLNATIAQAGERLARLETRLAEELEDA